MSTTKTGHGINLKAADIEMTMLQNYEAIYEHGAITWLGEKPSVNQAHVIVTILDVSDGATAPLQKKPDNPHPLLPGKGVYWQS